MSEFKFACPVCGQHMMCDSSHGGSVMECPTCFQKIVAPQAPAPDAKFILTGTKLTEKKVLVRGADAPVTVQKGRFPVAAVVLVVALLVAAGAGLYFFGGKLFGPHYDWKTADIGNVRLPGTFSQSAGKLTLSGCGSDIWDKADAFRFAYLALNGDGTITARVLSQQNTDPWAKAGVMWRNSLDADAKYALVAVTPGNGATFQMRLAKAANALDVTITPGITAPHWVRLTRQGELFSAFSSADGESWTTMGSANVSLGRQAYVGFAVSSHNEQKLCHAQFDHITVQVKNESAPNTAKVSPPKPKLVAPPANDTNWTLHLEAVTTLETPVAGRIHGQDFIVERATHVNGGLILRQGSGGPVEFGAIINFSGATPETLAGKTLNIAANGEKAARITLHWRDDNGAVQKVVFQDGYAMRLEFGNIERGRLPGKIYLCLPDAEKSYLAGKFDAAIVRPKPKPKSVG